MRVLSSKNVFIPFFIEFFWRISPEAPNMKFRGTSYVGVSVFLVDSHQHTVYVNQIIGDIF